MASYQQSQIEMALHRISECVYVGLCLKLGTPQQLAIRREIQDIREVLTRKGENVIMIMMSGSRREGFRLKDSDIDVMIWPNNHKVIWDFSQAQLYDTHRHTLFLCDSSDSPPGFTLLWLPFEAASGIVLSSCVRINGPLYLSSAIYRQNTCTMLEPDSILHGPYSSRRDGPLELDYAHCFVSDFWPPSATSWINRCHSWPPPHVVNEIFRSGCHFVAIGRKHGKHAENEWRISFSQAEQKLVYSMNHTQFLTYGLLKLFVKEINKGLYEEEKLLCSYHMKTAIFWAIQQNTLAHWCPQSLMGGFWVCFKLLLKWVYEGVCPNFFIPENNMFLNKVHGVAQMNLFTRLYALYERGIAFLMHIPSIGSFITVGLCNRRLPVCTDERALISEVKLDQELFDEVNLNQPVSSTQTCMNFLDMVEQLIRSPLTQCQTIMLQKLTATVLQNSAFRLHNAYINTSRVNKHIYIADKMFCYMLKLAAKFGFVSDLLYIAMYFYKTLRYREALSVIETAKIKLTQPGLMYAGNVYPEWYTAAVGGQSWTNKMRKAVACHIPLSNYICFIYELTREQQSGSQYDRATLCIPPVITLYMLEFLCCRHVDPVRAQTAIDDLQVVLYHDRGVLVPRGFRDISWEILGICQQFAGNLQAARDSYQQSLREEPLNKIQTATMHRIRDLHYIQLHTN